MPTQEVSRMFSVPVTQLKVGTRIELGELTNYVSRKIEAIHRQGDYLLIEVSGYRYPFALEVNGNVDVIRKVKV